MNWTSSVNGEPGIFSEVMQALQNLNPQDKHCNLCFDAMSIRKQVIWSEKDNKYIGYCDFGNELQLEGINTEATEALFFMLISLNGRWKLPIGYVLQNKITATAQAEIVKSILKLSHQSGLKVWGITCDGAYTNISTMKILGCKLGDNYSEIKCWFPHPTTEEKVYFIPDACHNLKLARNILGNSKVLKSDPRYIRWSHISNLHNLQQDIKLKFANKLSDSTADALQFLKQQKVSSFENIDATEEYCRAIDQLFDFLNSKNIYAKNFKSPITKQNIVFLENKIIPLIKYLYSLKYDDQLLHTTGKKTFIHGFAIAVKSLFSIARSIFADESLNFDYLLTYKFSQDHLELLFCQIRQRGGSNNNPNVMQLKTAVKQILIKNALKLKNNGNCNTFDDDAMCNIFDFKWNKNSQNDQFNDESDENDPEILQRLQLINNLNPSLQAAKENILYYILGYIITKVVKQLDCNSCKLSLLKQTSDHNYYSSNYAKFVNLRNNGGLVSGSESTFKIIIETEKCLLTLTDNLTDLNKSNLKRKIIYLCSNKLSLDHTIFKEMDCNSSILERPHKMVLITVFINRYLNVRLKSFGKQYTASINTISKRHKLNKLILFSNH